MNKVTITIILLCFSSTAFTQGREFDIGLEGGPSLIYINEVNAGNDFNPWIGFSTGPFMQYNFSKFFSIRTSVSFERKGDRIKPTSNNYNYLVVPLLFRVIFTKRYQFYVNIGPYFGYLLNAYAINRDSSTDKIVISRNEYFKKFDSGLTLGLGAQFPIYKRFAISIEIRNNLGLYQIVKEKYSDEFHWLERTNSTNLLVGFVYCFGSNRGK